MGRRTLVLVVLAAVVVSSVTTWIASAQIRSPAEVAARTAAPAPSVILARVVERPLATRVVSRGTAHYGSPRQLQVTPSALKSGPRVITHLPRTGSMVAEGVVVLTISGRPVFLLEGAQPSYRDLGPGVSGLDVLQLERALRRLGLSPGAVDGAYDDATGAAVARLYRRPGVEPVVATDAQLASVRPSEAELVRGSSARGGVQLPADEVVFVPATPVRVTAVPADLGDSPDGPLVRVTGSRVVIDGLLRVEDAASVEPGAEVMIDEPALGINASGTVRSVAARPGIDGADGFHVAFEVAVTGPPPALVGASVRLTIPIRSTRRARLTVPVSAVSLAPDGGARVQLSPGGPGDYVTVRTGLSADGFVAVTPTEGGLTAGDQVVIGFAEGGGRRG